MLQIFNKNGCHEVEYVHETLLFVCGLSGKYLQ
jgi:hypothetical protein